MQSCILYTNYKVMFLRLDFQSMSRKKQPNNIFSQPQVCTTRSMQYSMLETPPLTGGKNGK